MPTTLTVDLDTLTPETAQKIAGFVLALAGFEDEDTPELPNPTNVFGPASTLDPPPPAPAIPAPPVALTGIVANAGPHLVIPAPPAQAPAAAPIPPAPGVVDLDKNGLPWDGRIHAATKARNKDNSWKTRRGVEDVTIAQVESELRRLMAIPSPQHGPAAPVVVSTVAAPAAFIPIPPAPAPAAPSPIQITPQMQADYVSFIGSTSNGIHAGKLTEQELLQCLASVGVDSLPLLGARLDLLPSVAGMVNGIIAGRSV